MTAPYAPGFVPGQPQQPAMPSGYQYAQQPGFAPPPAYPQAPSPGYGQPQFQPPQQQPQMPQVPPQLGGADLNQRLYGPGIPAELQGKTVGEGLRYYGIMREDFIRRGQQPQQQPQQFQQPQQQYQQPQQGQPQQQSAQPRAPQIDPVQQHVADAIRQVLPEMLAPVVQPLQQQNFQRVYQETKSKYPDWAQHEAVIIQSMQGADAQTLSNPGAWEAAYRHAVGDAMVRARQGQQVPQAPGYQPYGFGGFQVQPQAPQQPNPQAQYGPPQMGVNGAPTFVESSTPAPVSMPQQGYDPADEIAAKRFGMPIEIYRTWKGGKIGLLQQPAAGIQPQTPYGQPVQPQYQPQYQQPFYPPQPQYPPQGFPQIPPGYYQPPSLNGAGYGR